MINSETQLRVHYYETDTMGYVHHSNYIRYFETARTEMFRQYGISYAEMEANGVMMPVIRTECRYIQPARFDELLTVCVTMKEMPAARMRLYYEITNEERKIICEGMVELVFVNGNSRRPCRVPENVAEALKPYFER